MVFIHCHWKAFQETPTPTWSCIRCRGSQGTQTAQPKEHRSHGVTAGKRTPAPEDGCGRAPKNRVDVHSSHSFPREGDNGRLQNHHTGGVLALVPAPQLPSDFRWCWAGGRSLSPGNSQTDGKKAVFGLGQFLKTTQKFPQKATHHLVRTGNTFAEHRTGLRHRLENRGRGLSCEMGRAACP